MAREPVGLNAGKGKRKAVSKTLAFRGDTYAGMTTARKEQEGKHKYDKRAYWLSIFSPGGQYRFGVYKDGMPSGKFVLVLGEQLID